METDAILVANMKMAISKSINRNAYLYLKCWEINSEILIRNHHTHTCQTCVIRLSSKKFKHKIL